MAALVVDSRLHGIDGTPLFHQCRISRSLRIGFRMICQSAHIAEFHASHPPWLQDGGNQILPNSFKRREFARTASPYFLTHFSLHLPSS